MENNNDIREYLWSTWFNPELDDRGSFDGAYDELQPVRHYTRDYIGLSNDKLFGDIDNTITYLKELKSKGYVTIEHECDNYFRAYSNYRKETNYEYASRIFHIFPAIPFQIEKKHKESKKSG